MSKRQANHIPEPDGERAELDNARRHSTAREQHVAQMRGRKHFPQMARFFDMFSRIETLHLDDLRRWGEGKYYVVDALRNSLGKVTIDRLEVNDKDLGEELQLVPYSMGVYMAPVLA